MANRAFYCVIGVTADGRRDVLGIWASPGGEGAKFWLGVLTELRNRGAADVCIVVCDGLKGLPDAITTTWPAAIVQTCVLHLIRNTFRFAARQHWAALARDLRPVYTAVNETDVDPCSWTPDYAGDRVEGSRHGSSKQVPRQVPEGCARARAELGATDC